MPRKSNDSVDLAPVGDGEALRRVAGGETGALAGVYDRHHQAIFRFVSHAVPQDCDVEDLVHATFLTAARAAGAFDGRENCRPWLLGIAARLVARRRRTLARWARAMRELAIRVTVQADPQRELLARIELSALGQALAKLSDPKRVVLLMSEVEGLTAEEIAFALDVPVGTVWTRLHHARRELRRLLERGVSQ